MLHFKQDNIVFNILISNNYLNNIQEERNNANTELSLQNYQVLMISIAD